MTPEVIADRYRVQRPLGSGGMGAVWLCRDELLGRDVAVKRVGSLPGESTLHLARALREARSAAALNHRNLVAMYDAVEEDDHLWLVMEYVPSRTLAEIVAAEGRLLPERVAGIGAQAADGLAAAHAAGTTHRDVKPSNLLVARDDFTKVTDFGIARHQDDEPLTRSGMVTGTPAYFAPEQARGEDSGSAADVWALGASLYAAVEGHAPYPDQGNPIAMLGSIAGGPHTPPSRAGVLTETLERMMDRDPQTRWSMADAAAALHRIAEEAASHRDTTPLTVPATAPAAAEPDRGDRGRGPWLVLAAVLGLALVIGIGVTLLGRDLESRPSASPTGGATGGSGDDEPAQSKEPEPESEPGQPGSASPSEPTSSSTSAAPAPSGGKGRQGFVTDYYAALPDDTESAWGRLSSGFQSEIGSYDDYAGFWSTIQEVSVDGTDPAGRRAVDVTLTYTDADGQSEQEVRRIFLDRSSGDLRISGDEVVG